ncbi:MAG: hypothetical protein FRX48_02962 [Lasallia pustulata]|uniref:MULE transposase domain-containing protein n=1 Tax=Lasallia pustulata TaxID=136370 RepID=A0A5M8PUB8_9LECA|nr:MAG: hypothetical protein FRX48_02962 [Lasallia pustulata]
MDSAMDMNNPKPPPGPPESPSEPPPGPPHMAPQPPPEGVFSSLKDLLTAVNEHAKDQGYAVQEWLLEVEKLEHNHEAIDITGHPVHRKEALTETVSKFIANETRIHVRPGQIPNALRLDDLDIPLAIKEVYNEKGKQRLERLNWKKPIQALMAELSRQEDWYSAHAEDGVHRLSHLFFANMESLRLLFLNPEVLIMDCTYKTNRVQMPLLSILAYCQDAFESEKEWDEFYGEWMAIIHSKSAEAYDTAWGSFQDKWNEKFDQLVWYLDDTWLRQWKTRFVRAWTDRVIHFNTLVTSRAEGSHAVQKQALGTSSGDLLQVLDDIKLILAGQLARHEAESNLRRSRIMDHHNIEVFTHLKGKTSPHGLNLMA